MAEGFGTFQQQNTGNGFNNNSELELRIADLERKMIFVNSDNFRPESPESRQKEGADDSQLSSKVADIVWDSFYYVSKSNIDFTVLSSGETYLSGETNAQQTLRVDRKCRFRVVFNLLTSGTSDIYITTAHVRPVDVGYSLSTRETGEWVGFKITGDVLYGMTFKKRADYFNKPSFCFNWR